MAPYTEKMTDLASMSLEDLKTLESEVTAAFEEADNGDDLDAMSAAADDLDAVRAAIKATEGTSDEPAAAPAEQPEAVAAGGDVPPEFLKKDDEEDEAEAPSADAVEDEDEDEILASADNPNSDAVTASATAKEGDTVNDELPEDRQPVASAPRSTITAGADIPGYQHGTTFASERDVAEAFTKRLGSFRNVRGGDGEQVIVASIAVEASPERTLEEDDKGGNLVKIKAVTEPAAITASGGYCAPLETRYDIFGLGIADRPIRDALAGFQASRGGIRYTQPPVLSDLSGAVGVWTAANDANPTSPTTKPCLKVDCSAELTAVLDAVTMCLEVGNLQARAYPELVSRNNELAMIQHARLGDLTLLSKINTLSTAVTAAGRLGVGRDFLEQVGRAAAGYRHRHRMGDAAPLRVLAPAWVKDAIREDLTMGLPGDQLEWADAVIEGFFRTRRVNITWHLDDAANLGAAQAAGVLNAWPTTFEWQLFAEGTFLFLDGGTLDLGIVRDGDLVGTNDYKMFVETFEGVAKLGIESIKVTTTFAVNGQVARHAPTGADAAPDYTWA